MTPASFALFALAAAATLTIAVPGRGPAGVFEFASLATLAAVAWRRRHWKWNIPCAALSAVPLIGLAQLALGTTVSPWLTANATLQWASWAAAAWLAAQALDERHVRIRFLEWFAGFTAILAAACLAQPALGISYDDFAGPFQNRNTWASMVELALPAAVWLAIHEKQRQWMWWPAAAMMAASVVATGSRAGAIIVVIEFALLMIAASGRPKAAAATAGLAFALAAMTGWETLAWRMRLGDPLAHRREFVMSSVRMMAERPISGFGLGTFAEAYPRFAIADFGRTVNHLHNDWLEWSVDGGIALPLLVALALLSVTGSVRRHWWAAGIAAVALHALADYPFARSGLSVWIWILAASAVRQPSFARARSGARESVVPAGRSLATARR
ncbi:MAG: O-antigen ligase family protein [Bryobacteraceae bacterium]